MFTSIDYDKFRSLRVTHVATRLEELIQDEANDTLTPEQLFLTAVDDALESRRINKVDKLIRQAAFPIPGATVAEVDYRDGRGITPVRMRRYAAHDWRADATNLLIISPTGGGKTYLACALAIGACQSEHSVLYFRMDDLARRLVIARGDGIAHQKLLNELSNIDDPPQRWREAVVSTCSSSTISSPSASTATLPAVCSRSSRTGSTGSRQ